MLEDKLMDEAILNDFDQLKAEIASNVGLILKNFSEIPSTKTKVPNLFSFLSDISENHQNAHLVKILTKLKEKIIGLDKRIQAEQAERQIILREKAILIKEIKRLRGESEKIKLLNSKIDDLENNSRNNQNRLDALIKEKHELVSAYDRNINELSRAQMESAENEKRYSEVSRELDIVSKPCEIA
jgi:chromosome segregation ATPase